MSLETNRICRFRCQAAFLLALAFGIVNGDSQPSSAQIYQQLVPSVLTVEVQSRSGTDLIGSAVVMPDGVTAVTAWHLLEGARDVQLRSADESSFIVKGVIAWDAQKDIALIRLPERLRPTVLAADAPVVGERIYVIGAPRGFEFSLSEGLISQRPVVDGFRQYQLSCPISPGNSGGPVVNAQGEVLGVVCWSKVDAQNLSFATPIDAVERLDPNRPLTLWRDLPRDRSGVRRKDRLVAGQQERDAEVLVKGLPEFRDCLGSLRGRQVVISVIQGNDEQVFRFKVPKRLPLTE